MWWRDLLFVSLVGGGLFALGYNLIPPREPKPVTTYDAPSYQAADFVSTVAKVDASFRNYWAEWDIAPVPPASDLAVARRLALGLMGTVPSLEEIRQFESLPAHERMPWWIDHVLQDRRSADYLAERFARAFVGTEGGPFILFRRRRFVTWLGEQLHQHRPYDQIVRDLIATQGLWTDQPATNFVSVTSQQQKKNQPDPIRLAGRVTRAFLGIRLDCAQCHNHPFAEWKQTDFQALAAFFGQTHIGFTGVYDGDGEFEATEHSTNETRVAAPRVPFAAELLPEEGSRRERLAAWAAHPKNGHFARAAVNRVWALMLGRPLVEPVDNIEADVWAPDALHILADDFAAHGFDLRRLIRIIASTEVFRLDSAADRDITEEDDKAWAAFPLIRLRPEQVVGSVIQASSVTTIDLDSHIITRLIRAANQNDFVKRYGDSGDDEFDGRSGTIPQRLLMMNGTLIHDRIKDGLFNATARIAMLAKDDRHAVDTAYLTVLTRRPTPEEAEHFTRSLADPSLSRAQHMEDLFWALVNSTEFSWNH
ncbi:MAG: DUF1549 and DUF1553 domain-containing protein [Gemmataceae bacterium]|nr:DUF1549 and DUF1553 domain-containing protein [Gemmataceae bacterium]